MQFQEPHQCRLAVDDGLLGNANGHYKKQFRDLAGLYADEQAFGRLLENRGNDIAYEVTSYTPGARTCDLIMGVTRMEPGKVGNEYYMTRGHIHARADRPEIYYGQAGSGLMQMESPDGEVRIIEVGAQSICYVPPYWIHRSINVGDENLILMFAYPADSGQDYGIIERSGGMRVRIMDDGNGKWTTEDNPDWCARSDEEIARIVDDNEYGS